MVCFTSLFTVNTTHENIIQAFNLFIFKHYTCYNRVVKFKTIIFFRFYIDHVAIVEKKHNYFALLAYVYYILLLCIEPFPDDTVYAYFIVMRLSDCVGLMN